MLSYNARKLQGLTFLTDSGGVSTCSAYQASGAPASRHPLHNNSLATRGSDGRQTNKRIPIADQGSRSHSSALLLPTPPKIACDLAQRQFTQSTQIAGLEIRSSHTCEPFVALVFPVTAGPVGHEIYFGQIFHVFVAQLHGRINAQRSPMLRVQWTTVEAIG